jgi:hypothetical protein
MDAGFGLGNLARDAKHDTLLARLFGLSCSSSNKYAADASIRGASRDEIHAAPTAGPQSFLGISAYRHADEQYPEQHLQSRDHSRGLNHLSTRDCA